MADPALRFDRLLSLLPRLYTTDPDGTALGVLLRAMAGALTRLDDDIARVMLDHWVGLASGEAAPGRPGALEQLGQLVAVPRLQHGADDAEPVESYRERLQITARALTGGLATPAAILSLAFADLGLEACPRMQTRPLADSMVGRLWGVEATIAWGLSPRTRRRCAACRSGVPGECPMREARKVDGWIAENPLTEQHFVQSGLSLGQEFTVESLSLVPDRPVLRLRCTGDVLECPVVQSRRTGETVVLFDTLREGDELVISPALTQDETAPFANYDQTPHHGWLAAHPFGWAYVVSAAAGVERDVSQSVYTVMGSRFHDTAAREAGAAFGESYFSRVEQRVTSPLLSHGPQHWRVLSLPNPAAAFDAATSRFADDQTGSRFARFDRSIGDRTGVGQVLFDELTRASDEPDRTHAPVTLQLSWITRPPATFHLRIPRTVAVEAGEARGATLLLQADVAAARAAGVRFVIDFPQPRWRDEHRVDDGRLLLIVAQADRLHTNSEIVSGEEAGPEIAVSHAMRDVAPAADRRPSFQGRFDVTPFDWSNLADVGPEPS